MQLSCVIPVYNEAASLPDLVAQVGAAARMCTTSDAGVSQFEILLVDDGSTDSSWAVVERLAGTTPEIRAIRFRRNFGKAAALAEGFAHARGELIMMLDADLQDDPAELAHFVQQLNRGFDLVNGWKQVRHDPWHKVLPSRVFNGMISGLTGVSLHDHNCGIKLMRAQVARELTLYGELHRFIPVLAAARGFRVCELPVQHRARLHGVSKYGFQRFARGFLDLLTVAFLTGYGQRPQHLLGGVGLALLGTGMLGLIYLAGVWIGGNVLQLWPVVPIGPRPLLAYSIACAVLGGQAVSLGLLAGMLVHFVGRRSERSSIAATLPAAPVAMVQNSPSLPTRIASEGD